MLNREEVHSADILLVDDVPGNLDVLFELLQTHRHTVRTAINGALALRTIAAAPPDLILLDVMMPDMDGFEVCRRLKANPDTAGIPIIFITALNELEYKITGLRLGAADYVTKPFQAEEVLARVKTQLTVCSRKISAYGPASLTPRIWAHWWAAVPLCIRCTNASCRPPPMKP